MATPQRDFPNGPQKNTPAPLGDDNKVARDVGARVGFGWMWIALAIIIILVVWFGGFGWGTYGGWWWGNHARAPLAAPPAVVTGEPVTATQPAPANSAAVISGSGLQILASTNRQAMVGQRFVITNAPVQQKSGNRAFWISAANSAPMLVVLANGANGNVQQGVRVNITGEVERAPTAAQAKHLWSLTDAQANQLEQQGAYVVATAVKAGQP